MKFIDSFLNSYTMYRVVLYGLSGIACIGILFGFLGILPYTGVSLLISFFLIMTVAYTVKMLFVLTFKAQTNIESSLITALILFLILAPVTTVHDGLITVGVAAIAMASKFVLVYGRKHIFNPAAVSIFLAGLFGFGNGIWWIGSSAMLPFVLILGLLIVRKIRRFEMFGLFFIVAMVTITLFNLRNGLSVTESVSQVITSWPIFFFGTVMLTEPLTSPHRKKWYLPYAAIVGLLFGSQFSIGPLFSSPEFALVVGNLFAFIVSPKYNLLLKLKEKIQLGPQIYEFVFSKDTNTIFLPGQYFEWTLPEKIADGRGNRRYFTIASSPTEDSMRLAVRIEEAHASKFKKTLLAMEKGGTIGAGQLSGDFVLPLDATIPLVFIAGGIGITPFRSMIGYLLDTNEKREVTLFYTASDPKEFIYTDIFKNAISKLGIRVVYVITKAENTPKDWKGEVGRLTPEIFAKYLKGQKDLLYYISGPNAMVDSYKYVLKTTGVSSKALITDYFPGY